MELFYGTGNFLHRVLTSFAICNNFLFFQTFSLKSLQNALLASLPCPEELNDEGSFSSSSPSISSITSLIHWAIFFISFFLNPRVVIAGVPKRIPDG